MSTKVISATSENYSTNWIWPIEQEPVVPGCFLRARAIGLMPMIDQVPLLICYNNTNFKSPIYHIIIMWNYVCLIHLGRERWQNYCSWCRRSRISSLQWYSPVTPSPSSWNPPFLWRLYPYFILITSCCFILHI